MTKTFHESYSRDDTIAAGSERSFGIVMTVAFAVISLLNWWHNGHSWRWTGGIAAFFVAATLLYPPVLRPLNQLWFKIGLLLHRVVNPIVMALVFFGTVLPTGLIMRMLGKDPMRLRREPNAKSYWIERRPPGPTPQTMKDQF